MNQERIEEIHKDFVNAFLRLEEALSEELSKGTIVVDGTIQRFEFTFELAWKLARAVLNYSGIEADTPRYVIKEAYKAKIIQEGDEWIDMLEDRNKTSHIYDEKQALKIYQKIKDAHFETLKVFKNNIKKLIELGK